MVGKQVWVRAQKVPVSSERDSLLDQSQLVLLGLNSLDLRHDTSPSPELPLSRTSHETAVSNCVHEGGYLAQHKRIGDCALVSLDGQVFGLNFTDFNLYTTQILPAGPGVGVNLRHGVR